MTRDMVVSALAGALLGALIAGMTLLLSGCARRLPDPSGCGYGASWGTAPDGGIVCYSDTGEPRRGSSESFEGGGGI
jgi:hypothetical protein